MTDEFRSYRDELVKWLDSPRIRIETQERFLAVGHPTLVKLSQYITWCDAVVHLVGDRTGNARSGSIVGPAEVQELLRAHPDFVRVVGLDLSAIHRMSYTQWEAWLAIYHRKRLFIAVPDARAARDLPFDGGDEEKLQSESQRTHLAALAAKGHYPEVRFSSSQELCLGLILLRDLLLKGPGKESGLTSILSLSDYEAGMRGFRRFLSSDVLPFQPPDLSSPCHPEVLLRLLETSDDGRGALLAGPGGVGKTRTSYEVGKLAQSRGWRVVVVLPGQPAVSAEAIMEAVFAHGPGKTMVIIEYLDQMYDLDLGLLQRQVIQASSLHGIQFGMIANCRPGFLLKADAKRDAVFDVTSLSPSTAEARHLSRFVASHSAPTALALLGDEELQRICGHRAIIALLIAQQLEQLAASGKLDPGRIHPVRSGDLSHWLRRRLDEDGLTVPSAQSIWESTAPPPHLVAAAAALACSPDEEGWLVAAAGTTLGEVGHSGVTAPRVIAILKAAGWLERDGPWLNVVHDVVADELVEQVVFDLDSIRIKEICAILSAGKSHSRSLGRLSTVLTRLSGAVSSQRAELLRATVSVWLRDHAETIGQTLADDRPDDASYAFGGVLSSMMAESAIEQWSLLVAPWLVKHGRDYEARHLLFRGLRTHRAPIVGELVPKAIQWLELWRKDLRASFILGPLLRVDFDSDVPREKVLGWSFEWLARFSDSREAQFVLTPLLTRTDLSSSEASQATSAALDWLSKFSNTTDSQFVLVSLLRRSGLTAKEVSQAESLIPRALSRLVETPLTPVLLQSVFDGYKGGNRANDAVQTAQPSDAETVNEVATLAIRWLERFPANKETPFVLAAMLSSPNLNPEFVNSATTKALELLEHQEDSGTPFLLSAVLSRTLDDAASRRCHAIALAWIQKSVSSEDSDFVLRAMLEQSNLDVSAEAIVVARAVEWLEKFPSHKGTNFVLRGVLERRLEQPVATAVIKIALQWSEQFPDHSGTDFVLTAVLRRSELSVSSARRALALSLNWLEKPESQHDRGFLLKACLERLEVTAAQELKLVALALAWLKQSLNDSDASFILVSLLARGTVGSASDAVPLALKWLETFVTDEGYGYVLKALLSRLDLTQEQATATVSLALQRLERLPKDPGASFVLKAILGRHLDEASLDHAVLLALGWAEEFPGDEGTPFVLGSVLGRVLTDSTAAKAATLALKWLEACGETEVASFVFQALFLNARITHEQEVEALECAVRWIRKYPSNERTPTVLIAALRRSHSSSAHADTVLAMAMKWLEQFADHAKTASLFSALLIGARLSAQQIEDVIALMQTNLMTLDQRRGSRNIVANQPADSKQRDQLSRQADALLWLERHPENRCAAFLFASILRSARVRDEPATEAIARALSWVVQAPFRNENATVICAILRCRHASDDQVLQAVEMGLNCLEQMPDEVESPYLLRVLLRHATLTQPQANRAAKLAVAWAAKTQRRSWLVIVDILQRFDIDRIPARAAISLAMTWLEKPEEQPALQQVRMLCALFGRRDLSPADMDHALQIALRWLEMFSTDRDAARLFERLLQSKCLSSDSEHSSALAPILKVWLANWSTTPEARSVLNAVATSEWMTAADKEEFRAYEPADPPPE